MEQSVSGSTYEVKIRAISHSPDLRQSYLKLRVVARFVFPLFELLLGCDELLVVAR